MPGDGRAAESFRPESLNRVDEIIIFACSTRRSCGGSPACCSARPADGCTRRPSRWSSPPRRSNGSPGAASSPSSAPARCAGRSSARWTTGSPHAPRRPPRPAPARDRRPRGRRARLPRHRPRPGPGPRAARRVASGLTSSRPDRPGPDPGLPVHLTRGPDSDPGYPASVGEQPGGGVRRQQAVVERAAGEQDRGVRRQRDRYGRQVGDAAHGRARCPCLPPRFPRRRGRRRARRPAPAARSAGRRRTRARTGGSAARPGTASASSRGSRTRPTRSGRATPWAAAATARPPPRRGEAERRLGPRPRQRHPAAVPAGVGAARAVPRSGPGAARPGCPGPPTGQFLALVDVDGAGQRHGQQRRRPGPAGAKVPGRRGSRGSTAAAPG